MKSFRFCVAFLLVTLFAFQANSLRLAKNQEPLAIDIGDRNYFGRLGFKELLQVATHDNDATQTIANVFRYYVDGKDYFNYVQGLFFDADVDRQKHLTLKQFYEITDAQGVHRADAHRVSELVRGLPDGVHEDGDDATINAYTFNQAADILFAESVSIVTFAYIVHSSKHSRSVTVSLQDVELALTQIFDTFGDLFPAPNCDEIRYLFGQTDVDKDNGLNLQEFHIFLGVYLRYYKSGIQSNRFAITIMKDIVFEYVWKNEDGLGSRTDKINFLKLAFARFLQMTIYDKTQNQMSHLFFTKFDADGSGDIDKDEFTKLLSFFQAPENEVDVLFIAADTDGSGRVDFAEFVVTMTTLLRKLCADFGFNLIALTDGGASADNSYAVFKEALEFLSLDLISEETFRETFASVDVDHSDSLDSDEFARFISEVIGILRGKIRIQEEAQISAVAGINVNEVSAEDVQNAKEEASEQVSNIVYADSESPEQNEIIEQVKEQTGVSTETLNEAVHSQIDGASVEEVLQAAEDIATQEVIEAVTTAVMESGDDDCPTAATIEGAIEDIIESGVVDDIVEDMKNSSGESIVDTVTQVVEEEHYEEQIAEETREQEQQEIQEQEQEQQSHDEEVTEEQAEEVVHQIEEQTGYSAEDVSQALDSQVDGASVEEVIQAAQTIATEEVLDAVATAVLEEGTDCLTPEKLEETIHQVVEDGAVDEIIEEAAEEAEANESFAEAVSEEVEEQRAEEGSEESEEEEAETEAETETETEAEAEAEAETKTEEDTENEESGDGLDSGNDQEEPEDDSNGGEDTYQGDTAFIQLSGFKSFLPSGIRY